MRLSMTWSLALLSIVLMTAQLPAAEYFVAPAGDNVNDGLTEAKAFADIERADKAVKPGDTVTFLDGKYEHIWNWTLKTSGTPEAWITYRAKNRQKAFIHATGKHPQVDYSDAIRVNASYIIIDGFELSSDSYGNGVWMEDVHHIIVRNCHAHHCGGAGVASERADYITVDGNIIDHNSFTNPYDTSGISLFTPVACDDKPGTRMLVRRNICYANENRVGIGGAPMAKATDGNGIIMDWFSNHGCKYPDNGKYPGKAGQPMPPYKYGALVEGNVCYDNGARGICVTFSDNVTIRYNTLYNNCRNANEGTMFGDLGIYTGDNTQVYDNIVYAGNFARQSFMAGTAHAFPEARTRVTAANNLFFGGPVVLFKDCGAITGTINADPLFVRPGIDPATADFHLQPASPAKGKAEGEPAPTPDVGGKERESAGKGNMGAYQ